MHKWLLGLAVTSLFAVAPALADDAPLPGTRITVSTDAELPDPEALVKALEQPGDRHQVRVRERLENGHRTLTIDLWGNMVASPAQVLRQHFTQLASAQIDVSPLDDAPPKIENGKPGKRVIIKKQLREEDSSDTQ